MRSYLAVLIFLQNISISWSYFAGQGGTTFEQSIAYCESQGSTLASIHSESDFELAKATCKDAVDNNGGIGCFIGLFDVSDDELYVYQNIDDTPVDYGFIDDTPQTGIKPWCPNQPQNSNDRYCVHMPTSLDYCLNAIQCDRAYKALCNDVVEINEPIKFPNIGYLGQGYNLIKGNPDPTSARISIEDPGFEKQIVEFTYNFGRTTADGKYLIPDHVTAVRVPACSFSSTATTYTGTSSYYNHLSQSIAISGSYTGLVEASFSASASYKSISYGTYEENKIFQSANGLCSAYKADLELHQFSVTKAFVDAVNRLPTTIDLSNPFDPYFELINEYGTNYITEISMGSKYGRTHEFSAEQWSQFEYDKWNLAITASVSYALATGSASAYTEEEIAQAKAYDSSVENLYITVLGSNPPTDGNTDEWELNSIENPYPYKYVLRSISDLFQSTYLPGIRSHIIKVKQENINEALQVYCDQVEGCSPFNPDKHPQYIRVETSPIQGHGSVSCAQGYTAISCGYQSHMTSGHDHEVFWGIWPSSNKEECTAYNYFGADVYAVCVPNNVVSQTQIQIQEEEYSGVVDVQCPVGYKVTGCGSNSNHVDFEPFRSIYANSNGDSCFCYDSYGGRCFAQCASNVDVWKRYEISGTGDLTVSCKGEATLLGCGIELFEQSEFEKHPAFYANGAKSCAGYSSLAFKLYAWCGTFS